MNISSQLVVAQTLNLQIGKLRRDFLLSFLLAENTKDD